MTARIYATLSIYIVACLAIVAWQPVAVFFSIWTLVAAATTAYMVWLVKTRPYHRLFAKLKNASPVTDFTLWLAVATGAMVFAAFIAANFTVIAFIYTIAFLVNLYIVIPHIQNS